MKEITAHWISAMLWIALCLIVGFLGGRWTAGEVRGWYRTLVRPSIAPPNWVFGPVWTLLYALMALAAWKVSLSETSALRTIALALFMLQLALNLAWSWIFFRRHAIGAALIEVMILWLTIALTTVAFGRLTMSAAWLMIPYLAWTSFAAALNAAFWRLNRHAA